MSATTDKQKVVVVGAGPVGALAALYAATRGDEVEIYELRGGTSCPLCRLLTLIPWARDHFFPPDYSLSDMMLI